MSDTKEKTTEKTTVIPVSKKTHENAKKALPSGMKLYAFADKIFACGLKHKKEALAQ